MTKHTPGPWVADMASIDGPLDNGNDPLFVFVGSDDDETRMDICDVHSWHGIEQRDANARLIAAAPELLELARAVCETPANPMRLLKLASAAIAKAEGGAG